MTMTTTMMTNIKNNNYNNTNNNATAAAAMISSSSIYSLHFPEYGNEKEEDDDYEFWLNIISESEKMDHISLLEMEMEPTEEEEEESSQEYINNNVFNADFTLPFAAATTTTASFPPPTTGTTTTTTNTMTMMMGIIDDDNDDDIDVIRKQENNNDNNIIIIDERTTTPTGMSTTASLQASQLSPIKSTEAFVRLPGLKTFAERCVAFCDKVQDIEITKFIDDSIFRFADWEQEWELRFYVYSSFIEKADIIMEEAKGLFAFMTEQYACLQTKKMRISQEETKSFTTGEAYRCARKPSEGRLQLVTREATSATGILHNMRLFQHHMNYVDLRALKMVLLSAKFWFYTENLTQVINNVELNSFDVNLDAARFRTTGIETIFDSLKYIIDVIQLFYQSINPIAMHVHGDMASCRL